MQQPTPLPYQTASRQDSRRHEELSDPTPGPGQIGQARRDTSHKAVPADCGPSSDGESQRAASERYANPDDNVPACTESTAEKPAGDIMKSMLASREYTKRGAPQSVEEAREHIAAIRATKGVNAPGGHVDDLEAALELISTNMYRKPMHFVLELIQNADDNEYNQPGPPRMDITYESGTLRFDTNEIGFSRSDVEAICSIGRSTKPSSSNCDRKIGEKGIGFKSVFKVSDEVYVNTGYYSFMFTKNNRLGRLAPTWAEFPKRRIAGWTSIFLRLSPKCNIQSLIEELKLIDGRTMAFLRNLAEIKIKILTTDRTFRRSIRRKTPDSSGTKFQLLQLEPDSYSPYTIYNHLVTGLVDGNMHRNHTESQVTLAFPSNVPFFGAQKEHEAQQVYAYLPIRDYCFKFILQADFVLVGNREDIESNSAWNETLLGAIPDAIAAAIDEFNLGVYRFSWLQYVPFRYDTDDFFEDLGKKTLRLLSQRPILEAESPGDVLVPPSKLSIVPPEFLTQEGDPLIPPGDSIFAYVSRKYPDEATTALEILGVNSLSDNDFLNDLENFIRGSPDKYHTMPHDWHNCLSEVLERLHVQHQDFISTLPLIPLRQGQWISPSEGLDMALFFPFPDRKMIIPEGIKAQEIHQDIIYRPSQVRLLRKFKVRDADVALVCQAVLSTHANDTFCPKEISREVLISHVVFLCLARWEIPERHRDMWVMTHSGYVERSSEVYIDSDEPFSASGIFASWREDFHFLHEEYSRRLQGLGRFDLEAWAQVNLQMEYLPRLVTRRESMGSHALFPSDDLRLLRKESPQALLELLRRHWKRYGPLFTSAAVRAGSLHIASHGPSETEQDEMRQLLSSMIVRCLGGVVAILRETCLPRSALLSNLNIHSGDKNVAFSWPLLLVADVEDPSWDFLSTFGVTVEVGTDTLIKRLKQLRYGHPTKTEVSILYTRLTDCLNGKNGDIDIGFLQRAFKEDSLVFIPSSDFPTSSSDSPQPNEPPQWYSTAGCVWEGPGCLEKVPRMQDHYPSHSELFHEKLGLPIASLKTIVAEAALITKSDSLDYIRKLFIQLSRMIEAANYTELFGSGCSEVLKDGLIFPVWTGRRRSEYDELRSSTQGALEESWFVADAPYLLDCFEGHAPLLSFEPIALHEMRHLINYMFQHRRLSRIATKVPLVTSSEDCDERYTEFFRRRAKYIARLINDGYPEANKIAVSQLHNVRVYQADSVSTTWNIFTPWKTIEGRPEEGRVMLKGSTEPPMLKIYLTLEDLRIYCPSLELMEELTAFCGITRQEYILLLNNILVELDNRRIEKELKRRGVPGEISDIADDLGDFPEVSRPSLSEKRSAPETVEDAQAEAADDHGDERTGDADLKISEILTSAKGTLGKRSRNSYTMTVNVPFGGSLQSHNVTSLPTERSWWRPQGRNHGIMPISAPVIAIDHENDIAERQFTCEFLVSSFLHDTLDEYSPLDHWTSPLRCRAGHKPLDSEARDASTFTINDTRGKFRKYLQQGGYQDALCLIETPIFHIQVVAAGSSLRSVFDLPADQVRKSEKLSLANGIGSAPADEMFILTLVFGQGNDTRLAIYPDPWQLHRKGLLSLQTYSDYEACLGRSVSPLFVHSPLGNESSVLPPEADQRPTKFGYSKLGIGDIRLLELQRGEEGEPLKGSIHHVSLDNPGMFWAISYVWGSDSTLVFKDTVKIANRALAISVSLGDALRAARKPEEPVMVWVDAVCINQADNHEKVMQIRLMSRIFCAAEGVIAWLGHEYDGSSDAFGFLKEVRKKRRTTMPTTPPAKTHSKSATRTWKNIPGADDPVWNQIDLLLDRRWFKRVWITQELVLPRTVIMKCGKATMNWDHFFQAVEICERQLNMRPSLQDEVEDMRVLPHAGPTYALGLTRQQLQLSTTRHRLLDLLDLFSHAEAKIPRDKLFALLGLASDSSREAFTPDYDSSLGRILFRYAECFVSEGQVMDLLYRAGLGKSHSGCSWIPDWMRGMRLQTISGWDTPQGPFHAGKRVPPVAGTLPPSTLRVRGFVVDSIASTTVIKTFPDSSCDATMATFRRLLKWSVGDSYPTGETREDLLFRVPIGNARRPHHEFDMEQLRSYRAFAGDEDEWPKNLREIVFAAGLDHGAVASSNIESAKTRRALQRYWQTAAVFAGRITGQAVFCVTKGGYVGLVPSIAEVNDSLCVLHGAAVPFVIRRRQKAASVLIGECYIHGIMYGEALRSQSWEQDFDLS